MVSLLYAVEGPHEGLPLALELNREDGIIRTLPGGCQAVLGRADRFDGWWMDECLCQAPMQCLPSVDICCVCGKAVWSLSAVAS